MSCSFHKFPDFSCRRCMERVFYSAIVWKCTYMCKHRFGVQLFQNPPLCRSTHFTQRWLCKHGGVKVSSFSWLSSRYGCFWHVKLGKNVYFVTLYHYSLLVTITRNDNVLESTGNNVTSNNLVSYIYSLDNSLRPAQTVTKGNDVTLH
jgi:hypothetical protein